MHYKKFILTLTISLGASTACAAELSLVERLRADPANTNFTRHQQKTIVATQKNAWRFVGGVSLGTLAGYGVKALFNRSQGLSFSFPRKHKIITATLAAVGIGAAVKAGRVKLPAHAPKQKAAQPADRKDEPQENKTDSAQAAAAAEAKRIAAEKPAETKDAHTTLLIERHRSAKEAIVMLPHVSKAALIAKGKNLFFEIVHVQEPVIPADRATDENRTYAFYGKDLTKQVTIFINQYFAQEEVISEIQKLTTPEKETIAPQELSELTVLAMFFYAQLHANEHSGVLCPSIQQLRQLFVHGQIYSINLRVGRYLEPREEEERCQFYDIQTNPFFKEYATFQQRYAQQQADTQIEAEQIALAENTTNYTDDYIQKLYTQAQVIDQADIWDHAKASHLLQQLNIIINNLKTLPVTKPYLKNNVETAWRLLQIGQLVHLRIPGLGLTKALDAYGIQQKYHAASPATKAAVAKEVQEFFAPYKAALANNVQHYAAQHIIDLLNNMDHNLDF